MKQLKIKQDSKTRGAHWAWLLPILALAPLSLAAKGCNSAVVGDDCPSGAECTPDGGGGTGNPTPPDPNAKICGGLQGADCPDDQFCSFAPNAKCGAADQTGVCKTKPQICTDIYAPVCGCDDKTYSSDCVANGAGVSVASQGECGSGGSGGGGGGGGKVCGGLQGLTCADGQFCNFPPSTQCGSGDQTGTCATPPQACDKSYVPVCGCDDKTYGNACDAASAGVSVAHAGECEVVEPGGTCGTRGSGSCPKGQYCLFAPEADCGRSDAGGTCTNLPQSTACTTIYAPVCGCDGKTYGNDCSARQAGVSIDHDGACEAPPTAGTCGGLLGEQCDAGFFCDYPLATQCGSGDQTGTCTKLPDACDLSLVPVCGCDGMSYGNACAANMAGVAVASPGNCK